MRIDRTNEGLLFTFLNKLNSIKKCSLNALYQLLRRRISKSWADEEAAHRGALYATRLYDSIRKNPRVNVVSSTLVNESNLTIPALIQKIGINMLYDELGNQSTILVYNKYFVLCFIDKSSFCFEVWSKETCSSISCYGQMRTINDFFDSSPEEDKYLETYNYAKLSVMVLLFKKYADIRETVVGANVRRTIENVSEPIWNRLPFQISYLDSTWYTTIIKTGDFPVKSHWRWCPVSCRFTFVRSFMKHGYVRKAKKLVA